MARTRRNTLLLWIRLAAVVVSIAGIAAAWQWLPRTPESLHELAAWLAPYRRAWYALPIVMTAFVVFGVALVPVMLLIALTGIVFGPVLGPVYAMAGSLASASIGFAIGRRFGWRRVQRLGGNRILRLRGALQRNGTLAVYFVRKIPAPFTLVNIVIGASSVRYRDFLLGTTLGMIAVVIALAGFSHELTDLLRDPSPRTAADAALILGIPLVLAVAINRGLRRAGRTG